MSQDLILVTCIDIGPYKILQEKEIIVLNKIIDKIREERTTKVLDLTIAKTRIVWLNAKVNHLTHQIEEIPQILKKLLIWYVQN